MLALLGAVGTAGGFKVGTSIAIEHLTERLDNHDVLPAHPDAILRLRYLENQRAVADERWQRQMEANVAVQQKLDVLLTRLGKEGR